VLVEGHGESAAVVNLLTRLSQDLGLSLARWAPPIRSGSIRGEDRLRRYCELVRLRGDAEALLILADDDDGCPKGDGPALSLRVVELGLPFPVACVLAYREFESLFLPCVALMAGRKLDPGTKTERPGIIEGARFEGDAQSVRGAKEWLSRKMPQGRRYKPSVDQLAFTRMVDFNVVRQSGLPWFGTLERALDFLARHAGRPGVYPPAAVLAR
jgi:hypothetical protein